MSATGEGDAALVAEVDVDDGDVGLALGDERAGLGGAPARADDVAAAVRQQELEPLAQGVVIFDEQEADRQGPSCIGRGGGIRKTVPVPPLLCRCPFDSSCSSCAVPR